MDKWLAGDPEIESLTRLEEAKFRASDQARDENNRLGFEPPILFNGTCLAGPAPERQWLAPDWIPMGRATIIYGSGGEGKTLIAQMLATCCAIGAKWLGMNVRRCNSLLLFCEDDLDEMHRRQEDINTFYGCTSDDLGAMHLLPRLGEDNRLMTFINGRAHHTPLFDWLLAAVTEHEAGLIITDTLTDVFPGNENDRVQARSFAQSALGYLARETGAASLTLGHPSLTGQSNDHGSGTTSWRGTFRSQLYFESPKKEEGEKPDRDVRVLRRVKANYARVGDTIEVRWKNGVFVRPDAPTGIIASIERRSCERVFLELLDALTAEGRRVSDNTHASNYAPKIFAKRAGREKYTKNDLRWAMEALFEQREIALGTYKAPNRCEYTCIVRKGKDTDDDARCR